MQNRITNIDWTRAKEDAAPFLSDAEQDFISKWKADLFLKALERLPL
jgi:hypothetical protein